MDKERLAGNEAGVGRLTRRAFLGAGVAGAAALAGGRLESLFPVSTAEAADEPWIEATIPQLQALMAGGQLTSRELTQGYLERIASLNPLYLERLTQITRRAEGLGFQGLAVCLRNLATGANSSAALRCSYVSQLHRRAMPLSA